MHCQPQITYPDTSFYPEAHTCHPTPGLAGTHLSRYRSSIFLRSPSWGRPNSRASSMRSSTASSRSPGGAQFKQGSRVGVSQSAEPLGVFGCHNAVRACQSCSVQPPTSLSSAHQASNGCPDPAENNHSRVRYACAPGMGRVWAGKASDTQTSTTCMVGEGGAPTRPVGGNDHHEVTRLVTGTEQKGVQGTCCIERAGSKFRHTGAQMPHTAT